MIGDHPTNGLSPDELFTISELSELTGITDQGIREMIKRNSLKPFSTVEQRLLIRWGDFLEAYKKMHSKDTIPTSQRTMTTSKRKRYWKKTKRYPTDPNVIKGKKK